MAYDSNGNYSLPVGSTASTGQTILASQHNTPLADIETALSLLLLRDGRAPMLDALNMNSFRINGLDAGALSTDAATVGQVQSAMPVGSVVDYVGTTAPSGWLLCYGQAVSRTTYAVLFAVIGTTFGTGDGSTTFNLPDFRGRVAAGKDNMGGTAASRLTTAKGGVDGATLGSAGGVEEHTLTTAQIPAHTHTGTTGSSGNHSHTVSYVERGDGFGSSPAMSSATGAETKATSTSGAHTHDFTTASGGGTGGAHPNVQPTIVMNKIIKVSY